MEWQFLQQILGVILLVMAISLALFFIIREFMLWYWRINDIADNLEGINYKLSKLLKAQGIDYTHIASKKEVAATKDFTTDEDPLGGKTVLEWIDELEAAQKEKYHKLRLKAQQLDKDGKDT